MDAKKLIEEVLIDLGNNKSLTDVSSKIQIIVRLLGDDKLKTWYNCEFMSGYKEEEVPDYRISQAADIRADYFVPHGFGLLRVSGQSVPVANLGVEKYKQVMTVRFHDTISAIIEYAKHPENVSMSLNPYELVLVQKVLGNAQIQNAHKALSPSTFQTIIDSVQGRIIDLFMDLDKRVFNGELDIQSEKAKKEINQVINNYITAGIVQTSSGKIEVSNSTIAANIDNTFCNEYKEQLYNLIDEIERIAKETNEEFDDIAQELADIRTELQSSTPQVKILKKSFKALVWGASVTCKAAIEKLVGNAIDLLDCWNCR